MLNKSAYKLRVCFHHFALTIGAHGDGDRSRVRRRLVVAAALRRRRRRCRRRCINVTHEIGFEPSRIASPKAAAIAAERRGAVFSACRDCNLAAISRRIAANRIVIFKCRRV